MASSGVLIQAPAHDLGHRVHLVGAPAAPQGDLGAVVQDPAHRQVEDTLLEPLPGQAVQSLHRGQVLVQARLLKFGVVVA